MASSITYLRDESGVYGFACKCGHEYKAPTSTVQNAQHRASLVDCMIRYHETKTKKCKAHNAKR